jgi:hypothetical protein
LTAEKNERVPVALFWLASSSFVEWTPDGHLRHSRFIASREDKRAEEVRRDFHNS